jgi:hypothetical protein
VKARFDNEVACVLTRGSVHIVAQTMLITQVDWIIFLTLTLYIFTP